MNLKIKEINQKLVWEGFLLRCKQKTFLDSWNWGEFNKLMGHKIWRIGLYDNKNEQVNDGALIASALIIRIKARRGSFLFVPHGPLMLLHNNDNEMQKDVLVCLTEYLKKLARNEDVDFIRISPIWDRGKNEKFFRDLNFRTAPMHIHPELTWELDITPTEDKILSDMRKTTRYLIKKARNDKDIEIVQSKNIADIDSFNSIYKETAGRHNFTPFSLDYLKKEFSAFNPDDQVLILLGKYKNELIASAVILFWQGIGFYHQGASSLKYPKIPVAYLIQWEAIREAKKRGCSVYNFWGIAPDNKKFHPWAGISLFKKGFGGYKKEYIKTQDLPMSKKYWLNFIVERLRKIKRKL